MNLASLPVDGGSRILGGNKGGKIEKDGGGRVEDRGEPGVAASVRTGHLDQTTRYGHKPADNGVTDPAHL
jgi:hypothetical protein